MKKMTKSLFALIFMLVMLLGSSAICVNAADDALQVDGRVEYKVGDTLTYNVCLEGVPEKIIGIQMYVTYNPEYLKIDGESLETPKFPGAVSNTNLEGKFTFNWTNVSQMAKFTEKDTLVKANFEVLKAGKTDIKCFIEEMYSYTDKTLKTITEYTMTVEYSENGSVIKADVPPLVEEDPSFVAEHQGQFVNYKDGKGSDNKDADSEHQAVTAADNNNQNNANNGNNGQGGAQTVTDANGNVAATNAAGQSLATDANGNYVDESGNVLSTDASGNYIDKDGKVYQAAPSSEQKAPVNVGPIIIIIAIVLIIIAIVVIVILKIRSNKNSSDKAETSKATDNENTEEQEISEEMSEEDENDEE